MCHRRGSKCRRGRLAVRAAIILGIICAGRDQRQRGLELCDVFFLHMASQSLNKLGVLSRRLVVRSVITSGGKHYGSGFPRERPHDFGQDAQMMRCIIEHLGRRAIQRSEESIRTLACRHGISSKTVQKWHKLTSVSDAPMGPKAIHSTVLTIEEEATIVAFRRHTLLPLDDCILYALQPNIPHLTRSGCLQRHGIRRLPDVGGEKP